MYKMIAIDIDGTLLNDNHEVTKEVRDAIHEVKANGVQIVLCTGRATGGVRHLIKDLELTGEGDYFITYNGAIIQNAFTNEIVYQNFLDYKDLIFLYSLSLEVNSPMHFYDLDNMYTPNKTISKYTVYESYISDIPLIYRTLDEVPTDFILPKVLFADEPESLNKIIPSLMSKLKDRYTMVQGAPYYFEFLRPEVGKGMAVKRLADKLQIKQQEIFAIGDNDNDMTMIEYAGCGVAMGNAIPELKAIADYETLTNNEHGVAHAIRKKVLHNEEGM